MEEVKRYLKKGILIELVCRKRAEIYILKIKKSLLLRRYRVKQQLPAVLQLQNDDSNRLPAYILNDDSSLSSFLIPKYSAVLFAMFAKTGDATEAA